MIVRRTVGTGITKHERITSDGMDRGDREEHDRLIAALGGFVDPKRDFRAWLDRYEGWLARQADRQGIPNRGTAMVIYDAGNREHWCYATDLWKLGVGPISADPSVSDLFKNPKHDLARVYLTVEDGDGHRWGLQSVRWYFGKLMLLANSCREALEAKAWLRLAGCCIELGRLDNEFRLKWPAERAIRKAKRGLEKIEAGQNNANKIIAKKREAWEKVALQIWRRSMELRHETNRTTIRDKILEMWPAGVKKAPKDGLYLLVRSRVKNGSIFKD